MKLLLMLALSISLHAQTKIITVKKPVGWKWTKSVVPDNDNLLTYLNKLSDDKTIRNIQINRVTEPGNDFYSYEVFYQIDSYEMITKTVEISKPVGKSEVDFLKDMTYERAKDMDTGTEDEYIVYGSGDWALVVTGGHAFFSYYYQKVDHIWVKKNEPANGEGVPKGAPREIAFTGMK